jgi:hypothetical protein
MAALRRTLWPDTALAGLTPEIRIDISGGSPEMP